MKNVNSKIIIFFTAILGFIFPMGKPYAGTLTSLTTAVTVSQAASGHITRKDANKKEIRRLDRAVTSDRAYADYVKKAKASGKVPMPRRKWGMVRFRHPETQRQYRKAGVISAYNPYTKQEEVVVDSPSHFGPADQDGRRTLHYYHEDRLDSKPYEFILYSDLDDWKRALTPPGEEGPKQAAAGFLGPDDKLYLYDLFFHPSIPLHEAVHAALRKRGFENLMNGEGSQSYFQTHLNYIAKKVYATKDREAIAAFDSFMQHLTYKYILFSVSEQELKQYGAYNLKGRALMQLLTNPNEAGLGNAVSHEFFAFTRQMLSYPEFNGGLFRKFTEAEKKFFADPKLGAQTPNDNAGLWALRFLNQAAAQRTSIQDALAHTYRIIKLDIERGDFDKFSR